MYFRLRDRASGQEIVNFWDLNGPLLPQNSLDSNRFSDRRRPFRPQNCLGLRPGHFVTFPPEIFDFEPRSPVQNSYGSPCCSLLTFQFGPMWADRKPIPNGPGLRPGLTARAFDGRMFSVSVFKANVGGSKTDPERPGLTARAFGATLGTDCWSVRASCADQLVPNGNPTTEYLDP